ncbi:type VII secretion protein EccB, partial [Nocardia sp. NPDC052566]|uniref:type VII secretion protein EccB n=1 Tax=Nocardia sp. NPDC052566 TaxID=3364330 RepID=UPI0037CC5EAA
MPAPLTTRAQVNGYRFLLKRIQHALVRRDVRMLHDPMRAQIRSMVVGFVLAVVAVAGCLILGLLRPQGAVGDAKIIIGKDSGMLFVLHEGTLHPALNLASARLISGSGENPQSVKESKLAAYPRGPILGIAGAPGALLGSATAGDGSAWTLCEAVAAIDGRSRIVLAGTPSLGDGIRRTARGEALLVRVGTKSYLLYDGKRAEVDLGDDATVRSLRLDGAVREPRTIGTGLLNATVEVPALRPPPIAGIGTPGPVSGTKVGSVIKVAGVESTELYVVLSQGVQRISPFAAEVIRNADSQGASDISAVQPDALRRVPVLDVLPIGQFPKERPQLLSPEQYPVVCAAWAQTHADQDSTLDVLVGRTWPLSDSARVAGFASGGHDAERVEAAYIRPNSGEFVQMTGIAPGRAPRATRLYKAETPDRHRSNQQATTPNQRHRPQPTRPPWAQ